MWERRGGGARAEGLPRLAAGRRGERPAWGLCACSYQLGSGEARLVSEDPINDGEWHRVTVLR